MINENQKKNPQMRAPKTFKKHKFKPKQAKINSNKSSQ
jgi:hypothetical protein